MREDTTATDAYSRTRRDGEELLVRAAALIARGWCRGTSAEDASGRAVDPSSPNACRWSPLGAVTAAWRERHDADEGTDALEAAYAALAVATGGDPEKWNAASWRTKWHVLRAFARARALLAREQAER